VQQKYFSSISIFEGLPMKHFFSMNKCIFLTLIVSCSNLGALPTELNKESIRVSSSLKAIKLLHENDKFVVEDNDGRHEIENHWLDSGLRRLAKDEEALHKFLEVGTIQIKQDTEGNYSLKHHVRAPGGGPITGAALYWLTKGSLWGTAGAAVAATAAPVVGLALTPVAPAAGAIGGAIYASTAATAATVVTEAVAGSSMWAGLVGLATGIEIVSDLAFVAGCALPLP
jgi:hypothetical protein